MDYINEDFSGVFNFTNPTDKERKYLWNNREYVFPPMSTVPLIIPSETLEGIQEIRKKFAYRMAEERFYEGDEYNRLKVMGNGLPPTFDPKILEPMIQECLKPLAVSRATIKAATKSIGNEDSDYKISKAMDDSDNPVMLFAEENKSPKTFGKQPG